MAVLDLRKLKGSIEGLELWNLLAYARKFHQFVYDYPRSHSFPFVDLLVAKLLVGRTVFKGRVFLIEVVFFNLIVLLKLAVWLELLQSLAKEIADRIKQVSPSQYQSFVAVLLELFH